MPTRIDTSRDALQYACPVCASRAGEPCTAPTAVSWRYVSWFHLKREDLVK